MSHRTGPATSSDADGQLQRDGRRRRTWPHRLFLHRRRAPGPGFAVRRCSNGTICANQILPPDGRAPSARRPTAAPTPARRPTTTRRLRRRSDTDRWVQRNHDDGAPRPGPHRLFLHRHSAPRPDCVRTPTAFHGMICANQIPPATAAYPPALELHRRRHHLRLRSGRRRAIPGTYAYQCQNVNRPESYNPQISAARACAAPSTSTTAAAEPGCAADCASRTALPAARRASSAGSMPHRRPAHAPKGQDLMANKSRRRPVLSALLDAQVRAVGQGRRLLLLPARADPARRLLHRGRLRLQLQPAHAVRLRLLRRRHAGGRLPAIVCPNPGTPGTSMEGYPATLYCCNFVNGTEATASGAGLARGTSTTAWLRASSLPGGAPGTPRARRRSPRRAAGGPRRRGCRA